MQPQIRISENRRLLEIRSEPYVLYARMGYQPAINVFDVHSGAEGYLIISAVSLSEALYAIGACNGGALKGLSISIQKENSSRMSKYIVVSAE